MAEDHHRTEELLKQSGVAWTILRNQIYMEVTLPQAAEMVAAGQVVVGPDDLRAAYVARSDCAAAAAAVLTTPGHEFRTYEITGPEIIGPAETARLASAVTGVPIDVVENEARPGAGTAEPPNPSFSLVSTALAELIGRPPTTAREVLEAHREALLAGR